MSTFILTYFMHHDREGILPVNTFTTETAPGSEFVKLVNYHVGELLQKFFNEPLPDVFFWISPIEEFNPEEEEGYGYVFAEQESNDLTPISTDPYTAAVNIVSYIITYTVLQKELVDTYTYSLTDYKVSDIPAQAPVIDETEPVDPRFVRGEKVVDRYGRRFKYLGVYHDPLYPKQTATSSSPDFNNKNVRIGVENREYVSEKAILDFIATNKIFIYPIPPRLQRHLTKGTKWFALSADGKKESYGKTQKEVKESFAFVNIA